MKEGWRGRGGGRKENINKEEGERNIKKGWKVKSWIKIDDKWRMDERWMYKIKHNKIRMKVMTK